MRKINVVFVSDAKSVDKCIISMLSVIKNKAKNDFINFYFIADEFVKLRHLDKFFCLNTDKSKITFIHVNSKDYDILRQTTLRKDLPNNAYYRLSIADKLPDEERAIYIDFDTYVCQSLFELFNTDIDDCYLAAVRDIWEIQRKRELKKAGIHTTFHYNSGMMLLNLKKWRKDNIFQKLKEFAKRNPQKLILADQFLINSVIKDKVKLIDYRYNMQIQQHFEPIQYIDLWKYNKEAQHPVIVHYIFGKPWEYSKCQHPLRHQWWNIAREYPYYEEFLYQYIQDNLLKNNIISIQNISSYDYNKIKNDYIKYKLLSKITFGKKRKKYKHKRKELKAKIKQVKHFLRGK